MSKWFTILALLLLAACQRDGFECAIDTDCFIGEACVEGTCAPATCEPETDSEICRSVTPCQLEVTTTDRCGGSRTVTCSCGDGGSCDPLPDDEICESSGTVCGSVSQADGCGAQKLVECGTCPEGGFCIENECRACEPPVCPTDGTACGVVTNGCGETIDCGNTCGGSELCIDNLCAPPFLAPGIDEAARFGEEIRATSDRVAIGAPGTSEIWLYGRYDWGWKFIQRLSPPENTGSFGGEFDLNEDWLLAVSDGTLVVHRRDEAGLYVVVGDTPLDREVLDISLTANDEFFIGYEESLGLPTLFVGACADEGCEISSSWTPGATDPGEFGLGHSLDSAGEFTIAGAPFDDIDINDDEPGGSLFVLSDTNETGFWPTTNWLEGPTFYKTLDHTDILGDAYVQGIGRSVAMTLDGLAISGAPLHFPPSSFSEAGAVYLIGRSLETRWSRVFRVVSPGPALFGHCGHAVGVTGDVAIASCVYPGRRSDLLDGNQEAQTRGRVFRWTWVDRTGQWVIDNFPKELADRRPYDHFGWAIEGADGWFYVSAPGRNDDVGEVWIYPSE